MIGLSTSWCAANGLSIYDSVKKIRDMGFELVEIGAAHRYEEKAFDTLRKIKKDFDDLKFTVHCYFPPLKERYLFNPCYGLTKKNKEVVDNIFKTARVMDASVVSVHNGHLSTFEYKGVFKDFPGFAQFRELSKIDYETAFENALKVYKYALELSKNSSAKFAIENMTSDANPFLKSKENFIKVFDMLPELNFLYDLGHDVKSNINTYDFFELQDRMVEVHMHDVVDGLDHRRLGTGRLDLAQISKNKELLKKLPMILEHAANVSEEEILEEKRLIKSLLT